MSRISKNLKKLRTSKNMTQDALAEKLFVTRQTISGWENDRTQPDIDMLCKISQVLDVSVEELIYGKKKLGASDEKSDERKRTLITIFSIIAAVLTGTGIVLIFIVLWGKLPLSLQAVFSFLPMIVGFFAAGYTYLKRRKSVVWCEVASVLWCAGAAATVALVNNAFEIIGGFSDCLLADILMFLPAIYILDAVTPLLFYYVGVIYCCIGFFYYKHILLGCILIFSLFFLGFGYVLKNRQRTEDLRQIYAVDVSVIEVFAIVVTVSNFIIGDFGGIYVIAVAFCLCMYIFGTGNTQIKIFEGFGFSGMTALSVSTLFLYSNDYLASSKKYIINNIIATVFVLALVIACFVLMRKFLRKDVMKLLFSSFSSVSIVLVMMCVNLRIRESMLMYALLILSALGVALTLTAKGVISGKFIELNIGLIATAVIIGHAVSELIEISMLTAGILLVLFGIILLVINIFLYKRTKKRETVSDSSA